MKPFNLLVILVLLGAAIVANPQHALAESRGCASISHLSGALNKGQRKSLDTHDFWQGDVIAIYLTLQSSNGSATLKVTDPRGDWFFTTFPAVQYYKFDQMGSGAFAVENLDSGNGSTVNVSAVCTGLYALPIFTDGRVNMDTAQEAAVYCNKGGVDVWRVIQSHGYFSLHVTKATIDKIPKFPVQNTLIAEDKKYLVRLYRLTSGELQVNATSSEGKGDYVFVWKGCDSGG